MFKSEMMKIAEAEGMKFGDDSELLAQSLKKDGSPYAERKDGSQIVFLGVSGDDGVSATASNVQLGGFEISLSFREGSNADFARAFADRAMTRLSRHWTFSVVPDGSGALPKGGVYLISTRPRHGKRID